MRSAIGLTLALSLATLTPGQASEIKRLEEMLMAPCCYTQTIRVHMSDVAQQMREEVTEFVVEGETEQEILQFYKAKYGEAILAVPDGLAGQLAFGVPIALFAVSCGLLSLLLVKFTRRAAVASGGADWNSSEADLQAMRQRIQMELGE